MYIYIYYIYTNDKHHSMQVDEGGTVFVVLSPHYGQREHKIFRKLLRASRQIHEWTIPFMSTCSRIPEFNG